ncbi:TDRD12 [Branchiostoma lanceolatum]|uniref:RNA helicase n=1 Tax=Branchiostoma lanceolatum TaxID=7740 RepID=A0A8K0A6H2_BRALA|nr:TDRD12 [Branchiostoma lanceolatum]
MEITILKVVKADHFWAIETFGTSMSEETRKFLQLTQQMNDFFSMDQAMCVPAQGQLCAGRRPDDKLWYRVRVKNILHSKSGPQACCFLLDYAKECLIPCHWLREAPPQFMQLPWQAREFHLYGLQPTTLTTDELTFVTDTQPCDRYDTAANEYVNKLVDESCGARVDVHYVDSNGVSHVKLYLRRTTNTVCVNDDLVSKGYAKEDKEEPSTSEGEESPVRRRNKVPSIGERLLQGLMPQKWEEPSRTQAQFTSHSPSGRPLSLAGHQMSALGLTIGDGVAVKGDIPPKPCTMLEKATFPEFIKQYLETENFPAPSKVQAYCWPAIMRGRDLVAMAPAKMGKTLAYLLPLMTQLAQTAGFEGLPEGNGPRSIILCPYWNSARYVYDQCWNYIADQKSTKVLLIFGAGAEDDQMVPLINGCDLLIATPRCLLRMLEKRYTNLDRLCHLVVDDADTLTEVYTDEIKSLMRLYGKAIADQPDRSAPRQIVLMARQWTAGIESFHRAYMTQPLLVFTSKVEEAVYSKVKQIVQVVHSTQRYTQLLGLLDQLETGGHKILVFAGSDAEAEGVAQ